MTQLLTGTAEWVDEGSMILFDSGVEFEDNDIQKGDFIIFTDAAAGAMENRILVVMSVKDAHHIYIEGNRGKKPVDSLAAAYEIHDINPDTSTYLIYE